MLVRLLLALAGALLAPAALAQPDAIALPEQWCGGADGIFTDSWETGGVFTSDPSLGSGGAAPGPSTGHFSFPPLGQQTWHAWVPAGYDAQRPAPLLIALGGYVGSHAAADAAAIAWRDQWSSIADEHGFIVVVPVSNDPAGSWLPGGGNDMANDYDALAATLDEAESRWNIERRRILVWGYSAGGHVAWDMLLWSDWFQRPGPLDADRIAALDVIGANSQWACNGNAGDCETLFDLLPRRVPVGIHAGTSDPNYAWAEDDYQRLLDRGWIAYRDARWFPYVGDHAVPPAQLGLAGRFLCGFARP